MGFTGNIKRSIAVVRSGSPHARRVLRSLWTTDERATPSLTYPAVEWLEGWLDRSHRVLEFGSGASTLFFAGRAGSVISIEHHPAWFDRVGTLLNEHALHADRRLIEPDPVAASVTDDAYRSTKRDYRGRTFRAYAHGADGLVDDSLDLALIDGRARFACARAILPKVRRGGWIVLDNAERPNYQPIHDLLAHLGAERVDHMGLGPRSGKRWLTTAYHLRSR